MDLISARTKDPPAASRAYALLTVAMYDAAVSAAHWRSVFRRRPPGGEDALVAPGPEPSYPSEHAAIAGAASRVLAYAFPERPAARYDEAARDAASSRVMAGANFRSDVEAGLALGRAVGDGVVARARHDGFARKWDGTRPGGEGKWEPPPGSVARPVAPLAGTWRTWVLESGSELRPDPPPGFRTAQFRAEAREVVAVKQKLTPEQMRIAKYWEGGEGTPLPPGVWNQEVLTQVGKARMSTPRAARALALVNVAMADAGVASWDTKYAYWSPRPENAIRELGIDPRWKPYLATPFFPAYVSGHAVYSGAASQVLAHLFPAEADRFRARGEEASVSRLLGGIHYRRDGEVGLPMGREIGRRVVDRASRDGAER
jgi:membrane-associated phospholipid phosphatase